MKKLLVLFGLMFAIFACSNDCLNMVNECLNGNFSEKNNNENNQGNSNTENPEKRPTTLQDVVDNANAGEEIDLSDYELTSYTATIDKKLTIKNGSLSSAKLTVTSENVKLEKLTDLSVTSSSRLTINDSKLSNLLIGGNGETSRSTLSSSEMTLAMVTVTDSEIENVELNGFNSQLNITDTVTQIDDILISTKAKVILEAGSYDGMKDPTVTNGGEAVRVDMTKKTKLSVLSIYSSPQKLEYNIGDKIDLAGLIVMGTYSTDVEIFKSGGWKSEGEDTITKYEEYEKDYTVVDYDFSTAGIKIVTIKSNIATDVACNFYVYVVDDSQNNGTSQPEKEEIKFENIRVVTLGTVKTLYKVGEKLDLSCYQVVGTYNGFEINLPFTSEPANGTPLTEENTQITFSYNGEIVDTQTITVTKLYYTVTFKDGGKEYTLEVADGELLKLPVVDERTGYTFDGWYKDDGTKIEAGYEVTENLTLTAKWNEENAYYVSNTGSDDEGVTGSKDSPFKTLQAAVNKVIEMNNVSSSSKNAPYRILLLSDITDELAESYSNNNNIALVNISPTQKLYLEIASYQGTYTVNASRAYSAETNTGTTGRVMYIGENVYVTLQNLILTGGYLKDEKGAGLYILNSTAEVTIKNCEIKENTIDNGCGAGIFVALNNNKSPEENLKLTIEIENSKISSNTINHNNGVREYSGAGIAIENVEANITIKDSQITGNKINQDGIASSITPKDKGVGLWLGNSAVTTISGSTISGNKIENAASTNENAGGGICIEGGTLTINEATIISGNSSGYGGGVYQADGDFTMNGGTIGGTEKNAGCTAEKGGGVYQKAGTFTMTGGTISGCKVIISGDNSTGVTNGGGVYQAGGTFKMENGTISGCTAEQGGGFYQNAGTFNMSGSAEINTCEAEKGGGVYKKLGSFSISGGKISSCIAKQGGGVYQDNSGNVSLMMFGGEISNCTAEQGGGFYQNVGTFTMSGGSISGNRVKSDSAQGGGVLVIGNFFMHKGNITNNELEYERIENILTSGGAGVAVSLKVGNNGALQTGAFTMNGGEISGNTIIDTYNHAKGEDLFVISGGTFTPNGGTINNDKIYNDNN